MNSVKVQSFVKEVIRDIERADRELLAKAANHVRGDIAAKIDRDKPSLPGEPPGKVTGNLRRGLRAVTKKTMALVGFVAPAYHAALLEFGTRHMAARPFLFTTFSEEAATVKRILSEERV